MHFSQRDQRQNNGSCAIADVFRGETGIAKTAIRNYFNAKNLIRDVCNVD
jgi:hypothetical protein